ncbi:MULTISPECIES: class III lanthionine synthetase LanKC [Stenotrophomonas]|uniref:class III lanthionine synthetase LanKC n=1 Tax=Stenotrophomonas TaxID=40323 RepID=UPI0022EA3221|nr:class III lanthionine synthetase LanKC [Stenotrophomonas pavanii]MDA3308118.1 class III lanthionine synthetase LanKC [Stenotrophomonas sp. PI_27]WGS57355.1 class III lanthionine synthetase LanKC [Stenotrophomonas pavanii]
MSYYEHSLLPSRFFEPIDAYKHRDDWETSIRSQLPGGWQLFRSSYWLQAVSPGISFPDQGFKLHVSPDYARLREQLEATVAVLVEREASFKVVADDFLVEITNSKNFPRVASGKFITIYPTDEAHFLALAAALRDALSGFHGPYILTDRRVPDSNVVFYRYGGLRSIRGSNEDGGIKHLIRAPDGQLVEDRRDPSFYLPAWVRDPFDGMHAPPAASDPDDGALQGRFEVESALHFSNSGGVYKATDRTTGTAVVLKEARPHCGLRSGGSGARVDAQQALRREYEILRRLEHLGCAPRPLQLFQEWEHLFLAQEMIDFPTWRSFFTREEVFMGPFVRGWCRVESFVGAMVPIMRNTIALLQRVHADGVILGDLSPNNIMIDPDTYAIRVIDVESATFDDQASAWNTYWATRGYGRPERMNQTGVSPDDDWYALGKCAMSSIIALEGLTISEGNEESISDVDLAQHLVSSTGLPPTFLDVVTSLLAGNPDQALEGLERLQSFLDLPPPERRFAELGHTIATASMTSPIAAPDLDRVADFIDATYRDASRTEFWPADPGVYATNKWNLAHGAAGIVAFLDQMGRAAPEKVERALQSENLAKATDEIGLYSGLAGLATYAAMRGHTLGTEEAVSKISNSPYRHRSADILSGEAGVGIAMLSILRLTGLEQARRTAHDCAQFLKRTAVKDENGARWPSSDDKKTAYFGYSRGAAGIAYFLAQYATVEGDAEAAELAHDALKFVIGSAVIDTRGNLQWSPHATDSRLMPYWSHGSAGIGAVLLRTGMLLDAPRYVELANTIANAAFSKLSVCIGQFDGLAGCLEYQTDLCLLTRTAEAAFYKEQLQEGIHLYARRTPEGIAFPGNFAMRLSCDFATGTAGVAMALRRARHGGSRPLLDFALPSAALFSPVEAGR